MSGQKEYYTFYMVLPNIYASHLQYKNAYFIQYKIKKYVNDV